MFLCCLPQGFGFYLSCVLVVGHWQGVFAAMLPHLGFERSSRIQRRSTIIICGQILAGTRQKEIGPAFSMAMDGSASVLKQPKLISPPLLIFHFYLYHLVPHTVMSEKNDLPVSKIFF